MRFNYFIFSIIFIAGSIFLSGCGNKNKTEAAEFFERGNYHFKKREYDRAIELFSEAIEKVPDFADAYNNRGLCFEKTGNLEKAMMDYREAVELDDSFDQAKLNLAASYVHLGDPDLSQDLFQQLEKAYADSSQFYDYRGQYYLQKNDPDRAINDFQTSITLNNGTAESLTNLGYAYYQKRLFEDAKLNFEKALNIDSDFSFALNNLSATWSQLNDWVKALTYSEKVMKENPNEIQFLNTHVLNLLENGRFKEANSLIEKALKLAPENPYSLRNAAVYHIKSEQKAEAKQILLNIEKENPEVEYLYYYLGISAESPASACNFFKTGSMIGDLRSKQEYDKCK